MLSRAAIPSGWGTRTSTGWGHDYESGRGPCRYSPGEGWLAPGSTSGTIRGMTSVICDDEDFAQLIGEGGLYDYELGERYIVAPAPSSDHGELRNEAQVALKRFFDRVSGPINLGVLGEPGLWRASQRR